MENRREFLKKSGLLAGALGMWDVLDGAIQSAFAIDPEPGSSFLDAEHVVILMQENRSFDHSYGTLQGVRGFNDPRAINLPNGNPIWVQTDREGKNYAPFRLDLKDTKSTWMGCLPHSWSDQTDARNQGNCDRWLINKRSSKQEFSSLPLTLGHYTREDIPFYYALADAFTICDQNFCSCLTGTTANRLHLWTGTIREQPNVDSFAHVMNDNTDHAHIVRWSTFPERLEDNGVAWKIYQNELSIPTGMNNEEEAWLASFGCNPMEYFAQYHAFATPRYKKHLQNAHDYFTREVASLQEKVSSQPTHVKNQAELARLKADLAQVESELKRHKDEDYEKLSPREKNLHDKAFTVNSGDPNHRKLVELKYKDGNQERKINVPAGDVLHQLRTDVQNGTLPTVSWIVPPEKFSDHPCSAWYGAWYISEIINILTKNPDVWKKTVFVMTYDENDGYFDHYPPFVAPSPTHTETGKVSESIDTTLEYITLEKDKLRPPPGGYRESSLGLGYRVPMIIASPWSRGGCVCSEVFDHTSVIQFLEKFVSHKIGKPIQETNINSWRRAVCGDLTSAFQKQGDNAGKNPKFVERNPFIQQIHQAKFKPVPNGFKELSVADIEKLKSDPAGSKLMSHQESGTRKSAPLPYDLHVNGNATDNTSFKITFEVKTDQFKGQTAGCPFTVYARNGKNVKVRNYAVAPGEKIDDTWSNRDFINGKPHLIVHGPNGFMREFGDTTKMALLDVSIEFEKVDQRSTKSTGNVLLRLSNRDAQEKLELDLKDFSYGSTTKRFEISPLDTVTLKIDTKSSHRWYDFGLLGADDQMLLARFAGRVETGEWGISDPAMGRVVGKPV